MTLKPKPIYLPCLVLLFAPVFVLAAALPQAVINANGYRGSVSVSYGEQINISWNSANATGCTKTVTDLTNNTVVENMQVQANVPGGDGMQANSSRMYAITCRNMDGVPAQDSVTIRIKPRSPAVDVKANSLDEDRPGYGAITVPSGSNVRISWVSKNATQCAGTNVMEDGREVSIGSLPLEGSSSGILTARRGFIVSCTNSEGVQAKDLVRVLVGSVAKAEKTTCVSISKTLRAGSRGAEVTALQKFLLSNSYLLVSPTGYFGPATEEAVKRFQKVSGVEMIGFVGPSTREKIKTATCK